MIHRPEANQILRALQAVLPTGKGARELHEPQVNGKEWIYVKQCLDSGWVSSAGKFVDRFEDELSEYIGTKRVVAVVNGTAALHVCLRLVGVQQHDEVLLPTLTFVATANAVSYCRAVPHFVDSEERTLGLDPKKLKDYLKEIATLESTGCRNRKTGRRIKAVLPMHTFGHPMDLDPLVEVCGEYQLELIEDSAQSIGSYYKGRHTGNFGTVSALSFNGNKTITTGGGGAIVTNNEELGELAKHLSTTAKVSRNWAINHDMIGYNYRMPNLNAALGCAQLERLPEFLKIKRQLAERYFVAFEDIQCAHVFKEPSFSRSNYWLNVLLMDEECSGIRDSILEYTNANGIVTRPAWTLLHKLPMFSKCPRMSLSIAESLERRIINIPSGVMSGVPFVEA